jgi:hypothetical protein
MSACDELRAKAAGVASLPERAEYLRHGRGCAGCMAALREGEKLMRLIESSPLPAPSPQALQRASAAILSELRAASIELRPATSRPRWLLQGAAAIPGFLLPLLIARHLDREGWAAALLLLAAAAALPPRR